MFFSNEVIEKEIKLFNQDDNIISFNIAYGADRDFLFGTGVSIASILLNNRDKKFHFHIFTDSCDDENVELFKNLQKKYNTRITVYNVDSEYIKTLPTNKAWNYAIYFRLIIADFFYGKANKVLYIDSDVFCTGNLSELMNTDISGYPVAAVLDTADNTIITMGKLFDSKIHEKKYFNSGVLLINTSRWNDLEITKKVIEILQNESIMKNIKYYDQDTINISVNGCGLILEKRFNQMIDLNKAYKKKIEKIQNDSVLVHFIGLTKPWHSWSDFYPQTEVFSIAKNNSPWRNKKLTAPRTKGHYKYASKHFRFKKKYLTSFVYYLMYTLLKIKI